MKITLCGSVQFVSQFHSVAQRLSQMGYDPLIPDKLGEDSPGGRGHDEAVRQKVEFDLIRVHWSKIVESDAILVLNYDKAGIRNYVGGNSFLEMGFAHVLGKKIFLLNPIPEMMYTAEMKAMHPVVLNGQLDHIAG